MKKEIKDVGVLFIKVNFSIGMSDLIHLVNVGIYLNHVGYHQ